MIAVNVQFPEGVPHEVLDCGRAESEHSENTRGYGIDSAGRKHCYDCCTANDLEQLRDTSRPFFAYVSCDGKTITNWPGRELMRITSEHKGRSGFGGEMHYYRAIDKHGRQWHGKNSGRGMCIAMRAAK